MQITCQYKQKRAIGKKYVISTRYSEALFPAMALGVVISVNIQVVFDIVRQKYI
jgi:hypothetical protein